MRICFYCNSIFTVGGVQRVTAALAGALSRQHEVTVLTLDSPASENKTLYGLDKTSVRFRYIDYPNLPFPKNIPYKAYSFCYKKWLPQNRCTSRWYGRSSFPECHRLLLLRELEAGGYDVIIGVHVFVAFHLAEIRSRLSIPVIAWLHTSFEALTTRYIGEQTGRFRLCMPKLDRTVVLTYTDKQKYQTYFHWETQVIYNPLTLTPGHHGDFKHRRFLAVGRLSPQTKGFDILIEAFARFARQNQTWTLDIVGEGPEEELLRRLITEYHLEDRITLHPFTSQIETYYSQASVYVLSSRWEGFPLVLCEALSHGLPVVATDLPVTQELLTHTSFVRFFRNGDAEDLSQKMLEMIREEHPEIQSQKAIQYARQFSLEQTVAQWEQLLQQVTANPSNS